MAELQIESVARLDYPAAVVLLNVPPDMDQRTAGFRVNACAKEPWTAQFIHDLPPGSVFWDCGANVGSYALLAAKLGHQVVAIEPACSNYHALCRNAARNELFCANDNLTVLPVALSDTIGLVWFQYRDLRPGTAMHVVGQPPGGQPVFSHRQRVMAYPLDSLPRAFGLPEPTHIKLDVDGGESAVLTGMEHTLRKSPKFQALLLEMQLKEEAAIVERLTGFGLQQAARFDQRNGQPIAGVCYGVFVRAGAPGG